MDRDVASLMMAPFSGNARDDFGRDAGTRRCLLLDIIMQGRKRESRCRLFQMPAEILADIVDLLADDKPALASLALVNSDCRYLARSCQFAEIHFDYGIQSHQLLMHLAMEALRGIDLTTQHCVITWHGELYDSIFGERADSYSQEQRGKLRREANTRYIELRKLSTFVVTRAMPNLEAFTWEDPFSVDSDFLKDVSRCSAQHIKLKRFKIDKPWLVEPPLTPARWPLRSLDLDVQLAHRWDESEVDNIQQERTSTIEELIDSNPISGFFETLFQRCAATLESLSWRHMGPWSRGRISLGPCPPSFPLLRYLRLGSISLSPRAFSSLFSSPLKHLEVPTLSKELAECLVAREPLRDLQSLIIPTLPSQSQACMHVAEFIRRHKHVDKLYVHERDDIPHLDRLVVPILANGGFNNLTCLSLAWAGQGVNDLNTPHEFHIPEAAIRTLGTLVSLERLSLRAGNNFGWRNQWLIDHDELRRHLGTLSRLKMLALVRDTYPISSTGHFDVERYYSLRLVGESERADATARVDLDTDEDQRNEGEESEAEVAIWERAHRNRMLAQAEAYAAVFPALEWILCGQRPMGFHMSREKAIPLTQHRDECYTFLDKTFGIYVD